jgi:hypothetical protein
MLQACSPPHTSVRPEAGIIVTRVGTARYTPPADGVRGDESLKRACADWKLDEAQVARFFALSREYAEHESPQRYARFYDLPCTIEGQLKADGRSWAFRINAASTATWESGDRIRSWGCSASGCVPLVLMMPDDQAP